jgi:hypothetical protein
MELLAKFKSFSDFIYESFEGNILNLLLERSTISSFLRKKNVCGNLEIEHFSAFRDRSSCNPTILFGRDVILLNDMSRWVSGLMMMMFT